MRERELDVAIRGPLASGAAEDRVLVLVEGEAGTGKSHVVRWLRGLPEYRQVPRLTAVFTPTGASVVQEPASPKGIVQRPKALQASLLGELAGAGGSGTRRLLVAEDVHCADEREAAALRVLLARPPAGLRVVLTFRPEELARPGLVLGAPVGYPAELSIVRLRLGPLSRAEIGEMAVEALGEERCPAQFVSRLHQRSGGNAQVAKNMVTQFRTAGAPSRPSAAALDYEQLSVRDVDEAAVPVRLAELVADRMGAMEERWRCVVWAAAVLEEPVEEEDLVAVAGLSAAGGRAALTAALSAAALHEPAPGRYGLRSPMEAAAVYQLLSGPLRRDLHGRAAEVLAAGGPTSWERLARHQFACGRLSEWQESVENAAREASEAGDHQLTVSLLEGALAHPSVRPSNRARLAQMLARSAVVWLRSDQTVEILRKVVDDRALPAATRGAIRLDLGLVLGNQHRQNAEGRVEIIKAVEELGSRPDLAARAMSALAVPYWPEGTLEENLTWLARAEAKAAESGDAWVQAAVAANRMTVLLCVGDPEGWRLLAGLPRESEDPRILEQTARGVGNAADSALWIGEYARAREMVAEFTRLNARAKGPYWAKGVDGASCVLDLMTGHWAGLNARVRATRDDVDAKFVLGLIALAKGDWHQAGAHLADADLSGDAVGVPRVAAASGGRIRLAMIRGDLRAAVQEAHEAWARLQYKGVWVWAAELAPWAVEATLRAGERDSAQRMVKEFTDGLKGRRSPSAAAALAKCRALLAEADGDLAAAAREFRHARRRYQALPRPYDAALAAEGAGRCILTARPKDPEGTSELDFGTREFETLGAAWDAARVRAELRAHRPAERRPPGRPGYGEQLSPREREVADLAGAGQSNREIAEALHLSPRTVEQHVARVLKKLGLLSRYDLAKSQVHLTAESQNTPADPAS